MLTFSIRSLSLALLLLFGKAGLAQNYTYTMEGFDVTTEWPQGAAQAPATETQFITATGAWKLYKGYTIGVNDPCASPRAMRMSNGVGAYFITPTLANGCGTMSLNDARFNRTFTYYTSTDNGVNWSAGTTFSSGAICNTVTITINSATVNRVKLANLTVQDAGVDNFLITSFVDPAPMTIATGTISPTGYCTGSSISVPYTASGTFNAGNTFTAQLSNASGSFTSPVSIGDVVATTSGTINATVPVNAAAGNGYRIRVVASNPSVTGTDNGADITVNAAFAANISYSGSPYCLATGSILPQQTGTTGGTFSSTAGVAIDALTGAIDLAASTSGTYTVTYSANGGSCPGNATTQVAIRPTTFIDPRPNQSVCAGASFGAINFTGAYGQGYTWKNSNPAIGLGASGSGDIAAFTAQNSGTTNLFGNISVMATGGTGCGTHSIAFRLTSRPAPSLSTPGNQQVCAGIATAPISFSSSFPGTSITWTNNNPTIGMSAQGGGDIPSFIALNNTSSLQTGSFTATPYAGGCAGSPTSFTIAVSPSAGTIRYAGSPYCQTGPAVPTRAGSMSGVFSSTAGLDLNPATGSVNLGASTPGTYTVTYTVAASGGCAATATADLTINPQAFVNSIGNQAYCNNMVTAAVPFTGNAASYSWTNTNPSIGLAASGAGTSLPSFTTVNAGPGVQYAYVRVTPQGNGSTTCPGRGFTFRIAVNYCGPVASHGDTGGDGASSRMQQSFQVGPNPARSTVVLQYNGSEQGPFTVQLVSQYGTPVGKAALLSGTTHTLDLSNITPGSYLLKVTHVKTGVTFHKQLVKL